VATNREQCVELDRRDRLAAAREGFCLPDGIVYLDGNSLGPPPRTVAARLQDLVGREWGQDLIGSWNLHGWIDAPVRIGDKIAQLIGGVPGTVLACDSTSVNLFKLLGAALSLRTDRAVLLSERTNFPTDLYVAEGIARLLGGGRRLELVDWDEIEAAIDGDTAVVLLTHVNYRTGAMYDLAAITARAHAAGALTVWDLAHSAGAMPIDVASAGVDFAVGCGYKYLNGGPGAPAFLYVAPAHQATAHQPLQGWFGHAAPFAFETSYRPAAGIAQFLCGTAPILAMAALECGIDCALDYDLSAVREKSQNLIDLFVERLDARCGAHGLGLVTPRERDKRGSQLCLSHSEGYPVIQALVERGVIGDFRAPDIMRFGFAPLYVRYVDVWDAVEALASILDTRAWDHPRYRRRAAVT
jgi:kynureninase